MAWYPDPKVLDVKSQSTVDWPDSGFVPAAIASPAQIGRDDLYLSIGRNLALATAQPAVVRALQRNARRMLDVFVEPHLGDLRAISDIDDLADQALVGFAHDMAVGVAGMCMQNAGYIWLDHAKRLLPKSRKRPDYVWATGHPDGGVAISEVKGMATSKKPFGELRRRTDKAFNEQIDDWKLDSTIYGNPVVAGYAIGLHLPGSRAGGIAIRRSVPCTTPTGTSASQPRTLGTPWPSVSIGRGHYRAALTFLGAYEAAELLMAGSTPTEFVGETRFDVVEVNGMQFAATPTTRSRGRRTVWQVGEPVPAMELSALKFALGLAVDAGAISRAGDTVQLLEPPILPRWMWQLPEGPRDSGLRALAPDGLALLAPYWGKARVRATWSPWEGFKIVKGRPLR